MCSITNAAHWLRCGTCGSVLVASHVRALRSSPRMLSCLLVTPALKSALPALYRVVSVCRFAHPHSLIAWCTRFLAGKKKLIKRPVLFHKPIAVSPQVEPPNIEPMEQYYFCACHEQWKYQFHVLKMSVYNDKKYSSVNFDAIFTIQPKGIYSFQSSR